MTDPQMKFAALVARVTAVTDPAVRRELLNLVSDLDESWRGVVGDAAQELSDGARVASTVSWRLASEHSVSVDPSSKAARKVTGGK